MFRSRRGVTCGSETSAMDNAGFGEHSLCKIDKSWVRQHIEGASISRHHKWYINRAAITKDNRLFPTSTCEQSTTQAHITDHSGANAGVKFTHIVRLPLAGIAHLRA